jgi:hypothetical protein
MNKIKKPKKSSKKISKKTIKRKIKEKKQNISLYTDVFIGPVG